MLRRLVGICSGPHDCCHNNIVAAGDTLMLRLTLCLVGATLGLCGLFAATALPARAQPQLQAKGRSEGAFVFYVGGPTAPLGGESENLRTALSRHQGVDHWGLLQRARQKDRTAAQ